MSSQFYWLQYAAHSIRHTSAHRKYGLMVVIETHSTLKTSESLKYKATFIVKYLFSSKDLRNRNNKTK